MELKTALIVGCGGIGSRLAEAVHSDIKCGQIKNWVFYLADPDIVEAKNCLYQNFSDSEICNNKAEALAKRFPEFVPIPKKISKLSELKGYDMIISAVDNYPTRK